MTTTPTKNDLLLATVNDVIAGRFTRLTDAPLCDALHRIGAALRDRQAGDVGDTNMRAAIKSVENALAVKTVVIQ